MAGKPLQPKTPARIAYEKWRDKDPERARRVIRENSKRQYHKNPQYSSDWTKANRARVNESRRKRRAALTRDEKKAIYDKDNTSAKCKMYGISIDAYNRMLEEQGHVCAICKNVNKNGRVLGIDHDHETGQVRGLLCNKCNFGIGHFNDSIALLSKASEYLASYAGKTFYAAEEPRQKRRLRAA